jgi:hypothetical protein
MYIWKIKFVFNTDRSTQKCINVTADTLTDAYVIAQNTFPNAEIMAATKIGKHVSLEDSNWLEVIAKYMIAHGTLDDATALASLCSESMKDELATALFDTYHKA